MPVYDYECTSCKIRFERKQRFDEEPILVCPLCQGRARRVIHSVPVVFKGGGFYTTDNRKGSDTSPAPMSEKGEAKKEEKKEEVAAKGSES